MARILYILSSGGGLTGGQKMIVRHVEALCDLGFDAACYLTNKEPGLIEHRAPLVKGRVAPEDVVVVADDAPETLQQCAGAPWRSVVFAPNPYHMARLGLEGIDALAAAGKLRFLAVAPRLSATLRRLHPEAPVDLVPCFADERRFGVHGTKQAQIAYTPRKRPHEAAAIKGFFKHLHPAHLPLPWVEVQNATETEAAAAFAASSLFLSLSRLESVGMTTLEAMASGCLCAGFTGIGGNEYATPYNGFWVPEDDCEAAADALAEAARVAAEGGAELARRLEAGFETARAWSYEAFHQRLEAVWMGIAPEARVRTPATVP